MTAAKEISSVEFVSFKESLPKLREYFYNSKQKPIELGYLACNLYSPLSIGSRIITYRPILDKITSYDVLINVLCTAHSIKCGCADSKLLLYLDPIFLNKNETALYVENRKNLILICKNYESTQSEEDTKALMEGIERKIDDIIGLCFCYLYIVWNLKNFPPYFAEWLTIKGLFGYRDISKACQAAINSIYSDIQCENRIELTETGKFEETKIYLSLYDALCAQLIELCKVQTGSAIYCVQCGKPFIARKGTKYCDDCRSPKERTARSRRKKEAGV